MSNWIQTERIRLMPIHAEVLRAVLSGDTKKADKLLAAKGSDSLVDARRLCELRLNQIEANPELDRRLLQAIVLNENDTLVGHIGFHTEPDAQYLLDQGLRGVELGYTVFEPYRRRGIATEAVQLMIGWGQFAFDIDTFVASIAPDNTPSIALVKRLHFKKVGVHIDEEDGPEDIYVLEVSRDSGGAGL